MGTDPVANDCSQPGALGTGSLEGRGFWRELDTRKAECRTMRLAREGREGPWRAATRTTPHASRGAKEEPGGCTGPWTRDDAWGVESDSSAEGPA